MTKPALMLPAPLTMSAKAFRLAEMSSSIDVRHRFGSGMVYRATTKTVESFAEDLSWLSSFKQ